MIVQVSIDAPLLVKAAAGAVLAAHIGGASLGLVSGTTAILARKGGRLHRFAGNVFFVAMLSMSAAAAISAPLIPDRFSAVMGLFVFYLTLTAWLAVQPPSAPARRLQIAAIVLALGVAGADLALARMGMGQPHHLLDDEPAMLGFPFATLALLAAVCDLGVLWAGRPLGAARVRRHLWRMSAALAIAWGSFAGQPRAQPEALRGSPLLILPALATLALLALWMIRTRDPRRPPAPDAGRASPFTAASAQETLS